MVGFMAIDGKFRRALITGASTGLGAAFAEQLAREGCHLVLVARNRARLTELAQRLEKEYRIRAEVFAADLTQPAEQISVEELVERDTELDMLVNNAGFGTLGRFADLPIEREIEEIELNVVAVVRLTRAALSGMQTRRRGAVINVSSLSAFQAGPYNATYAATKAYLKSFTEALSEELRGSGVSVQVLCPGFTHTEFQERAGLDTSKIPAFAWMTAAQVVAESLAALRRGKVVCVPGLSNRFTAALTRLSPPSLVLRITGSSGRRLLVRD